MCLVACTGLMAQKSMWSTSTTPRTVDDGDSNAVTVGLQFYSDTPGVVNGVRFYKASSNTGTHIGTLWSASGAQLATVTFSGETSSGWQVATFASPVSIAANTSYVISYFAPRGHYSDDQSYSWSALNASPLHFADSDPGVYGYGSTPVFPTQGWNRSNYWVDVLFTSTTSPPPSTYSISGNVSGSAATLTLSGTSSGTTKTDSAGNYTFAGVANGSYVVAPSQTGFTFSPSTAAVTVKGSSVSGVNFKATAVAVPVPHSVSLSWTLSTSPNVVSYNVYRSTASGGPYAKLTSVSSSTYVDNTVSSGQRYFYVTTAVNSGSQESTYSNEAAALIPTP